MLLTNFFTIVTSEPTRTNTFLTMVDLQADHPIFKGHFPGFPVTPGVGLLQILKELTEEHLGHELFLRSASHVKFLTLIDPYENARLKFAFTIVEASEMIKVKNTTSLEDGTIVLKCNVNFAKR